MQLMKYQDILNSEIEQGVGIGEIQLGQPISIYEAEILEEKSNEKKLLNWNKNKIDTVLRFDLFEGEINLFFRTDTMTLCEIHLNKYEKEIFGKRYMNMKISLENLNSELTHDFENEDVVLFKNHKGIGLLLDREEDILSVGGVTIFDPSEKILFYA